jgi:hypothetical protein
MKIKDSNNYSLDELQNMDKETAIEEITKAVYDSTVLLELLQIHGRLYGDGHHLRQAVCNKAKKLVIERWEK